jgi:hypothetical protein
MRRKVSSGLAIIDEGAIEKAIEEFNKLGRRQFLKRYGLSRSSKFYLIFRQRFYDTKSLAAAAYRHATGKVLRRDELYGGPHTLAVFRRLKQESPDFRFRVFEDTLGELRNLSTEYARIPRAWVTLRELGFSKWIPLEKYADLNTGGLPGVYVIANSSRQPREVPIIDDRVVYIGETVDQSLHQRLYQLCRSLQDKGGHSGGTSLRAKRYHRKRLWFAIRSFPLGYGLDDAFAKSFRSAQIRHLERTLLYEYVCTFQDYPVGNSK